VYVRIQGMNLQSETLIERRRRETFMFKSRCNDTVYLLAFRSEHLHVHYSLQLSEIFAHPSGLQATVWEPLALGILELKSSLIYGC
jgi:hypothetical protein